jgi:acetyltransferase-like isoleucine patch superfamily enzyme
LSGRREISPKAKIYDTAKIADRTELICDENTTIGDFVLVANRRLYMMPESQINAGAKLVGQEAVIMGEGAVISYNVLLLTSTDQPSGGYMHDAASPETRKIKSGNIYLDHYSFIGAGAIIFPDVKIGLCSVVGAGAVIKKSVPDFTVVKPDYDKLIFTRRRFD